MATSPWQLEHGAQAVDGGRTRFRVWAPVAQAVEVETYPSPGNIVRHAMARGDDGVWEATLEAGAGALYRYRLDGEWGYPDPYSRSQPEGVHGPSQVVDSSAFGWTDEAWRGLDRERTVIYELHVGAYTPEGTFDALIEQLDELRELGVTAIELMPVAEFPGQRNWGYDGVDLFAPSSVYGGPEALRRLVDAAHARGLGVMLDVVYNHLGPDGAYLASFSPYYFTERHTTPWGEAINFDGEYSRFVRQIVVQNALYWLHEYHIDGLRLDATHEIYDEGPTHILRELADAVREQGPVGRRPLLMAENERNMLRTVIPADAGGYGLDGIWLDDFHHSLHVCLTGERRGYLESYDGTAEEVARLLNQGVLHHDASDPEDALAVVAARQLVYCLQNHDQVGNRPFGERLAQLVDLERYKVAVAVLLLSPCTPLIFMGEEFAASTPFLFFSDHKPELGDGLAAQRAAEFKAMWDAGGVPGGSPPDPQAEDTFLKSKLRLDERRGEHHAGVYRLYRELLRMRREDPALRTQDRSKLHAAAIAPQCLAVERWDNEGHRRLLLANFGEATRFVLKEQSWLGQGEPLEWRLEVSTAEERFGGKGWVGPSTIGPANVLELPPQCAVLFSAQA